ncbi:MAG TPA: hypothetical protein DCE41_13595 [Cytophagales bacterium]|nr:hypothetical protein [Cytophagales bacterium]HAA22834.1 hypothetical protein [Cytophagales bacterium]HAP64462.1 hypothetical protein [Cytophagales bacterium]
MNKRTLFIALLVSTTLAGCAGYFVKQDIGQLSSQDQQKGIPFELVRFPWGRYDFWVRDTVGGSVGETGQVVDYLKSDYLNSSIIFFDEGIFLQISPFNQKSLGDTIRLDQIWFQGVYYFGFYRMNGDQLELRYRSGNGLSPFKKGGGEEAFRVFADFDPVDNHLVFKHYETLDTRRLPQSIPLELDLPELFAVEEKYEVREAYVSLKWWRKDEYVTGFTLEDGKMIPILGGRIAYQQAF